MEVLLNAWTFWTHIWIFINKMVLTWARKVYTKTTYVLKGLSNGTICEVKGFKPVELFSRIRGRRPLMVQIITDICVQWRFVWWWINAQGAEGHRKYANILIWHKTSYCKISQNFEVARSSVKILASLWNLAGASAARVPRRLPNWKAIGKL